MRDFGAYLTVTVGILILLLSGLCTLSYGWAVLIPRRLPGGAPELFNGPGMAPLVAVVGGAPMAVGAALIAMGLKPFDDRTAIRFARRLLFGLIAALGSVVAISWCVLAVLGLRAGDLAATAFTAAVACGGGGVTLSAVKAIRAQPRSIR